MLDYHSRSHTDDWSQTKTRATTVPATGPAAVTMAQRAVATEAIAAAPAYAWSAEPAAEYPAPAIRWSRMSRPMMFVGVGAATTAAVAAALVLVFSGPTRTAEVSTPNASTAITAVQAKTNVPTPPGGPSMAPRQQVHHSASSTPVAPHHVPTSYSSNDTTSNDTTSNNTTSNDTSNDTTWNERTDGSQYREGSRPWHDTTTSTTSPTWNFPFFRPHFDSSEHRDSNHDGSRGHHGRQSDDGNVDSSSDGHQ
jgi:hypothetical protein